MNHKKPSKAPRRVSTEPTPFEQARDELFQHIMRCDVVGSVLDEQKMWFDETMAYMAERYHELAAGELSDLRTLGERFSQPAKSQQQAIA
ncbi:MAG: hypothetical protein NTU67_03985 [Gemmatimonadetes bacterium]|jgi:hypothetical protein|nr:hypothetical protein [Gemmatimonadota bacterium]